jgi:hypothetical protein
VRPMSFAICRAALARCRDPNGKEPLCNARHCREIACENRSSHFHEAEPSQNGNNFGRFQDRNVAHGISGNADILDAHEFRFEFGLAILQQHGDDLLEIDREFIERGGCEWAPGKPGTKPTNKPVCASRSITAE